MITLPRSMFIESKLENGKEVSRRSIRFLIKKDNLIGGALIEEVLMKYMIWVV